MKGTPSQLSEKLHENNSNEDLKLKPFTQKRSDRSSSAESEDSDSSSNSASERLARKKSEFFGQENPLTLSRLYRQPQHSSPNLAETYKISKENNSWKRLAFQRLRTDRKLLAYMGAEDLSIPQYNVRRLLACTVPVGFVKKDTSIRVFQGKIHADYCLSNLWEGFREVSAFGIEVCSGDENGYFCTTGYVPSLSALVLYPAIGMPMYGSVGDTAVVKWLEDRPPYLRKPLYATIMDMVPKDVQDKDLEDNNAFQLLTGPASQLNMDKSWMAVLWSSLPRDISDHGTTSFLQYFSFRCVEQCNEEDTDMFDDCRELQNTLSDTSLECLSILPCKADQKVWHLEQQLSAQCGKQFWDRHLSITEALLKKWDCVIHPDLDYVKAKQLNS